MTKRLLLTFLLADLLLALVMFRDGLWGASLLAPLDLAPVLFSKFRYVDPQAGSVPGNHYIIDQLTYDLPLQYTIHKAYRSGEMPWWDPYTFGGRPLLADAHVNGTDPLRVLCDLLLPFELAYNWTLLGHWLLLGTGMFLLLRHWRFNSWICAGLALAWQLAGCHTIKWGHPWLPASYLYYPLLWWAWESWWKRPHWSSLAAASALLGLIFCTGNLQSHAYVVIFAGAFLLGYGGRSLPDWKRLLIGVGGSGLMGAALALPLLLNELEFYLMGARGVAAPKPAAYLSGLLSLNGVYPWLMGSFRTLDWGKFFSTTTLSYRVFVGSAVFALGMLGIFIKASDPARLRPKRTAVCLVVIYFGLIMSTPLQGWFYTRAAALAVLGLVVLAAFSLEETLRRTEPLRGMAQVVLGVAVATAVILNILGLVAYPRFKQEARDFVLERARTNPSLDRAPDLREFQLANFSNEVSFRNPEAVLGTFGLLALGLFLASPRFRANRWALPLLLGLNLVPLIHFGQRYIPRHSVGIWHRMLEGGPEQKRLCEILQDKPMRLLQVTPGTHEYPMPNAMPHLYRVRALNGYSALQPISLYGMAPVEQEKHRSKLADYFYVSEGSHQPVGALQTNANAGSVVFQWLKPSSRVIQVRQVSLNEVRLEIAAGPAQSLLWTDTYYPGWSARCNGRKLPLSLSSPCFTQIEIPEGECSVVLRYRPRYLTVGLVGTALASVGLLTMAIVGSQREKSRRERGFSPSA